MSALTPPSYPLSTHFPLPTHSISAQVIQRRSRLGSRSAGYGFVALSTIEAAQRAVELLNKTELEGRSVIVEIAKPAEEKSKEPRPPRKTKKRSTGRRGPKSAPGEITDAEANGEITDKAEAAPATEGAERPKKKKKNPSVSALVLVTQPHNPHFLLSAATRPSPLKERPPFLPPTFPGPKLPRKVLQGPGTAGLGATVPLVPPVRIRSANPPRPFSLLPTSASASTMPDSPLSLLMQVSMSLPPASFEGGGVSPEGARDTDLSMSVTRRNKRRPSMLSRAKRLVVAPSPSRSPSILPTKKAPQRMRLRTGLPRLSLTQLKSHLIPRPFPNSVHDFPFHVHCSSLLSSLSYGSLPAAFRSGEIQTGKLRFRSKPLRVLFAPRRRRGCNVPLPKTLPLCRIGSP